METLSQLHGEITKIEGLATATRAINALRRHRERGRCAVVSPPPEETLDMGRLKQMLRSTELYRIEGMGKKCIGALIEIMGGPPVPRSNVCPHCGRRKTTPWP